MQKVITTTTVPVRQFRRELGITRDDTIYIDNAGELRVNESHVGRKTLSRRLGVKATGAELGFTETGALVLTHVETNADLYDGAGGAGRIGWRS